MTTALSATGRITIPITVIGFTHKLRVYCRNPTVAGATFNINSRATDSNDTDWEAAAHDLQQTVSYLYQAGTTYGDAILEHYSGGVWSVLATKTESITDHGSGTNSIGNQITMVLRDLLFHKVKVVILEGFSATLFHYSSYPSIGAGAVQNFVKEFTSNKTLTNAPYNWMVGRGNQYLNTSPFVGLTGTSNRRVRRRRGLT